MLKYIFLAIIIYLLYNLVTKFILPVYTTTKRMQDQFRNIREQQNKYQNQQQPQATPQKQPEEKQGEYIDFEEVK